MIVAVLRCSLCDKRASFVLREACYARVYADSELALRTGVSANALRHYERLGLLKPTRRASGYREYTEAIRREVVFIAMSRKIGISLKAIAEQLPAYRVGRLSIDDMVQALQTRVADIDQEVAILSQQRSEVVAHIVWMKKQKPAKKCKLSNHPKCRDSKPTELAKPWDRTTVHASEPLFEAVMCCAAPRQPPASPPVIIEKFKFQFPRRHPL